MSLLRSMVGLPLWLLQIPSGYKSFLGNPLLGSTRLNRVGLHTARMRSAHWLAARRRARLARGLSEAERAAFAANGFILIENYLPAAEFEALRKRVLETSATAREMLQGDTITRRMSIDPDYLRRAPEIRALLAGPRWKGLMRYVASTLSEPIYYIQTILTHRANSDADPQTALHADTFQPTMKAWYFLEDVAEDEGPFCYVPGSHRLTPERLAWERERSIGGLDKLDPLSARGSMRVSEDDLPRLGLPAPKLFAVKANTLVVADTCGFHARGPAVRASRRVEIWAYSRRNPFYPWIGLDPFSLPGIAERRISWAWAAKEKFSAIFGPPWHNAGPKVPLSD